MDLTNSTTAHNLADAFAGELMANRFVPYEEPIAA